jgi:nucleoside-diphosphate-sugar epimerase
LRHFFYPRSFYDSNGDGVQNPGELGIQNVLVCLYRDDGNGYYNGPMTFTQDYLIQGRTGEVYNIGASSEKTNLELIETILDMMGKPKNIITFVSDRPGHDRRYALDATKISSELGWKPVFEFNEALEKR